jgi:hypothetical protein
LIVCVDCSDCDGVDVRMRLCECVRVSRSLQFLSTARIHPSMSHPWTSDTSISGAAVPSTSVRPTGDSAITATQEQSKRLTLNIDMIYKCKCSSLSISGQLPRDASNYPKSSSFVAVIGHQTQRPTPIAQPSLRTPALCDFDGPDAHSILPNLGTGANLI